MRISQSCHRASITRAGVAAVAVAGVYVLVVQPGQSRCRRVIEGLRRRRLLARPPGHGAVLARPGFKGTIAASSLGANVLVRASTSSSPSPPPVSA